MRDTKLYVTLVSFALYMLPLCVYIYIYTIVSLLLPTKLSRNGDDYKEFSSVIFVRRHGVRHLGSLPATATVGMIEVRPGGEILRLSDPRGPESVAFDSHGGGPYVSVEDGGIMRWNGGGEGWSNFATTRPRR